MQRRGGGVGAAWRRRGAVSRWGRCEVGVEAMGQRRDVEACSGSVKTECSGVGAA